jgi:hypothetical protein
MSITLIFADALGRFLGPYLEPVISGLFLSIPLWLSYNCLLPLIPIHFHLPTLHWNQAFSLIVIVRISFLIAKDLLTALSGITSSLLGTLSGK